MSDFLKIFKVLYKNQNAPQTNPKTGKKKLSTNWIVILSFLPIALLISAMLGFLSSMVKDISVISSLMVTIITGAQCFLIFMLSTKILQTLYMSEDNAFLSSLPIKPHSIYFARLSNLYINCLRDCALFLLPSLLTITIVFAAVGNKIFYGVYPLIFLIIALAPVLPLFLITLFSMPLVWLSSFFKGKAYLKTIFAVLFYVVLMIAYFAVIFTFNQLDFNKGMSSEAVGTLAVLSKVMYPNQVLVNMCLGVEAGKNFGIGLAILVGFVLVTLLLSTIFYKRTTSKQVESVKETSKKQASFKQKSFVFTLISKDVKTIMRNPTLAIGGVGNLIIAPILIVVMHFTGAFNNPDLSAVSQELIKCAFVIMYSAIFFGGANALSMLAFTREGQAFFVSKTLPINPKDALLAKLIMAFLPTLLSLFANMLISIFLIKISVGSAFLFVFLIMIFSIGMSSINIINDMKHGNVYWKTQADLRSNNHSNPGNLVMIFSSVVFGGIFLVMGFTFNILVGKLSDLSLMAIFWGVGYAIALVIMIVGLYLLLDKGVEIYKTIGEKNNSKKKAGKTINRKGLFK